MSTALQGIDLSQIPALAPPHGSTPNFVDPERHGYVLIVVTAVFYSLMLLVVALRLYSKNWVNRTFGLDDGEMPP